jgi:hypothetical protein
MQIENFPTAEAQVISQPSQPNPIFQHIGEVWELRLLAEAYCFLGSPHLIISDGLSFLVDRLVRGDDNDTFVFVVDEDLDSSDVHIHERLIEDLREGAEFLLAAVEEDQQSAHPRILQSAAEHVRAICRRLAAQT